MADWIHGMLKCEFFSTCPRHREQKKAEVRRTGLFDASIACSLPALGAGLQSHPRLNFPPAVVALQATYFCTDCCCRPLCGHCTTQHVGHRMIQVR